MNDQADIYLDKKPYRVNLATYQKKDIIDFAPRASVPNGSVFMSDLSLYQPLVQTDWRHGFGFHWYSDSAGYLRTLGNVDTRQDGLVMLMTNATATDTNDAIKEGFVRFAGTLYSWGAAGIRKYNGTVWSSVYSTTAVNFALATGTYLFFCPDGARIKKMTSGEVITDAGVDANATDYKWLVAHNGYIYAGKDNSNRVHYDSTEDLSQLEGTTADPGAIYCGLTPIPTLGAQVYAGQLYVAREDGLWLIGEDQIARRSIDYWNDRADTNFRSMAVINGLLVFAIRDRVVQWNGARVSDITPGRITDSYPFTTFGRFDNFLAVDNFLFCTARTNETTYAESLLCWDGVGWHRLTNPIPSSTSDTITAIGYDPVTDRLWYHISSSSDITYYIPFQSGSSFPYADFPTSGVHSLITSRFDMGFRRIKKSLPAVYVEARNVTESRYLSVYFSRDGEDWVHWDNVIKNGVTELILPGGFRTLEFNNLRLRIDFVTNDNGQSPVLESYTLRFIMRPDIRWGYSFDIMATTGLENEGMQDGRTALEIIQDIEDARNSKSPIELIDLAGEKLYGYITSVRQQPVYRTLSTDGEGGTYIEHILNCSFVEVLR